MTDDAHPCWAVYDLDRLRANLAEIRRRIGPDQACIAALKGNAYGHGAVPVARALDGEGLAAFMTGSFDEACRLRAEGLCTPIVMFAGALPTGMADLVGAGLVPTVVDRVSAKAAARAVPAGDPVPVYVKVNAGLGRLGVPLDGARRLPRRSRRHAGPRCSGALHASALRRRAGARLGRAKARRLRCTAGAPRGARSHAAGHPGTRKRLRRCRSVG